MSTTTTTTVVEVPLTSDVLREIDEDDVEAFMDALDDEPPAR